MEIGRVLSAYMRLPLSSDTIPGSIMEALLAYVREGTMLGKYDFVDVIKPELKCGWQVKSTKAGTPVTWKRAKIPNRKKLISESRKSKKGLQELGDAIIDFCNEHVQASLNTYELEQIGQVHVSNGLQRLGFIALAGDPFENFVNGQWRNDQIIHVLNCPSEEAGIRAVG